MVVAFGGDGTLNEVANGLAGTDVPVSVLPGGSTNVVCRTLGIPNDVVDATEHLLALADDWQPRKIDLGKVDERHFVFSCGVGIDATVVKRVDAHPRLKSTAGPYYYSWAAVSAFYRSYLLNPVRLRVEVDGGEPVEGVTALAQNSDPFTYFASRPVRVCEGIAIDDGTLSIGGAQARHPARHADPDRAPLQREPAGRPPPPDRALRRRHRGHGRRSISRPRTAPPRPSRSRSTATTSASTTRLELRSEPGALSQFMPKRLPVGRDGCFRRGRRNAPIRRFFADSRLWSSAESCRKRVPVSLAGMFRLLPMSSDHRDSAVPSSLSES